MDRTDRIKAFRMRMDGSSWDEIGDELGYEPSTVYNDLRNCMKRPPRQPNIRFPGLRRYVMEECGGSISVLADRCGLSVNSLYASLGNGHKTNPSFDIIRAITSTTGKTYEELFEEEDA